MKKRVCIKILRATRIERSLIPVAFIFLVSGVAHTVTSDVLLLALCCMLLYASGGLLNAKEDNDFNIPHVQGVIIGIMVLTIILALQNIVVLITVLVWAGLSVLYNKYSRRILSADALLLALTHGVVPIVSTALLLSLNHTFTVKMASFTFVLLALIIPMKNINGSSKDKQRKYKTFITELKNGKTVTLFLSFIHFLGLFLAYFIFVLSEKYLLVFGVMLIIYGCIVYSFEHKHEQIAYKLSRLLVLVFAFGFVFNSAPSVMLFVPNGVIILLYVGYLVRGDEDG